MDLWATKTHSENEDEEAERLVRQAPKYKPPRRDRRRETMDHDRDPDVDDDPDLKSDPDLSRNYKDIGGSLIHAVVAARFIAAEGENKGKSRKIKVRQRETGKVVNVSEETLKEDGGKYEKIDENAESGQDDAESAKRGDALRALAKDDEKLQNAFKSLLNAKSDIGGLAEGNPKLPAAAVFKGLKLPEGVETLGDMVKALKSKAPKTKAKEPPAPKEEPKEEAAPATQRSQELSEPSSAPETPGVPESPKTQASPESPPPPATGEPKAKEPETAPEGEAPKKPKGKKKDKKKPESDEGPPEEGGEPAAEPPEPSEAEKAGIKPPARREATEAERMEAVNLIVDTFPEDVATELLAKNLHPDDAKKLVNTYHAASQLVVKDPKAFAEKAASYYEPDIDRVKPPQRGKNADGELVPFKDLTPEEQSEAMREHQLQVAALSLGAKQALTRQLTLPNWLGKPRIAPGLASSLATFMLHKGDEKAANELSDSMFSSALGQTQKVDDKRAKQLLEHLSPGAKKLATAYFEAGDYQQAKNRFLGSDDDQVSEYSRPSDIMRAMKGAKEFFSTKAAEYGEPTHRAQAVFQVRVLDRLKALAPEKYGEVRQLMAKDQKSDYDRQKAQYDRAVKQWEARKKAWESSQAAYRDDSFKEPKPEAPEKPPLYHLAEDPKKARQEAESAVEEVLGRSKTASAVFRRFIFTYSGTPAMGQGSAKSGVYHGVDPKENYPGAYPGWQQAHQRDLGASDYTTILGAAKEWLKSSVLSVAIEGIPKDQQLRAALDLAIRDSKYAGQIQPTVYNELLARLAGVPKPGLDQTLLTIREANSSFAPPKKGTAMKPSIELRKLAARAAESDPKLAFDMIELAEHIEKTPAPVAAQAPAVVTASTSVDERYGKIKALVIRTAAVDGAAKKVLMPVLQAIKTLG